MARYLLQLMQRTARKQTVLKTVDGIAFFEMRTNAARNGQNRPKPIRKSECTSQEDESSSGNEAGARPHRFRNSP